MSDPSRPKPFSPHGVVDGCVVDSAMAAKMGFAGRFCNSCGIPFDKNAFCDKNMQWDNFRPYLNDRPTKPWANFYFSPLTPDERENEETDLIESDSLSFTSKNKKKKKKTTRRQGGKIKHKRTIKKR
jgi:hypothetical protein